MGENAVEENVVELDERMARAMIVVIQGGSGCGKSAYAEQRAMNLGTFNRYYLATMRVYDPESVIKVNRHKKMRAGKGFVTIESPDNVGEAAKQLERDCVVLLECMSNLAANEMFSEDGIRDQNDVVSRVLNGIKSLEKTAEYLLIVTNNVFDDGNEYDALTMHYIEALGRINEALAGMAMEVIEVIAGIPVTIKAENRTGEDML